MPLTPENRLWLAAQQLDLRVLTTRASIYAGALLAYDDVPPPPWWRYLARRRRRRGMVRAERIYRNMSRQVVMLSAAIDAWVAAHNTLLGEVRGPILREGGTVWPTN